MILIFETHPVQYRAPVYQELEKMIPGQFLVAYASDFSVRGYMDQGFGSKLAWDIPLLEGYPNLVLNDGKLESSKVPRFSARGVDQLIAEHRPKAIVLPHAFNSPFALAVYFGALRRNIPLWLRMEVQDEAGERGKLKDTVRTMIYRLLYLPVSRFFYIGNANKGHYLRHGVNAKKLRQAHYCARNPIEELSEEERGGRRTQKRQALGFAEGDLVVAFFGKLIPKKNPALPLNAHPHLSEAVREKLRILYVGQGEREPDLRTQAQSLSKPGQPVVAIFAGFVNQTSLPDYYLAADIVVLPSRKMGETWGVVINEALQAGCSVVVSSAVGCSQDFGSWERVRVIPVDDHLALARAIDELSKYPRSFRWAEEGLKEYSVQATAKAIADEMQQLT